MVFCAVAASVQRCTEVTFTGCAVSPFRPPEQHILLARASAAVRVRPRKLRTSAARGRAVIYTLYCSPQQLIYVFSPVLFLRQPSLIYFGAERQLLMFSMIAAQQLA